MNKNWLYGWIGVLLVVFVAGCAQTGRGEFPAFERATRSNLDLAILPTAGAVSRKLNSSILYHLDRKGLEDTYRSVTFVSARQAKNVLGPRFSIDRLTRGEISGLDRLTDADLVLGLQVNEFTVEEFETTETRTLYESNTNYSNTTIYTPGNAGKSDKNDTTGRRTGPGEGPGRRVGPPEKNGASQNDKEMTNTFITTRKSETKRREIPVARGNIRVVLSMSAVLYDRTQERTVWRGHRIERAQDELADLSSLELKDIVVERIMYRLNNRLN